MSARYLIKTDAGKILQTDGTSGILLSPNTLTAVSKTTTYKYEIFAYISKLLSYLYDITGTVARTFTKIYDINGSASSALVAQHGTVTLSALNSEICFITKTDGPYHYSCYIFLDNMASGDIIKVKVQVYDETAGSWKSYEQDKIVNYNDIDSKTSMFIPFLPANRWRVCIKQTAGTPRAFNWSVYKTP